MKNNYIEQNGCRNCKYGLVIRHVGDFEIYCTLGSNKIPEYPTTFVKEPKEFNRKKYLENAKKWDRWSKNREVHIYGICDDYKEKMCN
jgi:hypothetical protein